MEQEEKAESKRQRRLKDELQWIRMSQKARQAKGKARLNAYEELRNQVGAEAQGRAIITVPHGPRLGDKVIEVKDLTMAFEDKLLFENLTFSLPKAGIVGIIGPNGAGKTTLFKLITKLIEPQKGIVEVGDTVQLSYVNQERDNLNNDFTVFQEIAGDKDVLMVGGKEINSRAYVAQFNFSGTDQQKQVGKLSGGERNRVHLAKLLLQEGNVLLLDEPTNDLDVETLQALEQGILDFSGCAVIISHDRWFLDRIATHILAFEGDSKVYWHDGNYASYEENLKERLGTKDIIPKRIHYKKLVR